MKPTTRIELYSVNGTKPDDHVSDWIKDVESWKPGENIIITADTGQGKSFFVQHTLKDYFKSKNWKCLYLLPRTLLKGQFQDDLPNDDIITFKTYQSIEEIRSLSNRDMGRWDVVISDEAHYFMSDSTFNLRTDLSFNWIMEQKKAIKVFMSATFDNIADYFSEEGILCRQYVFPFKNRKIKSLSFFWYDTRIEELAEQIISDGRKAIIFIESAGKAVDLYQKYKSSSMFLCSEHNTKYSRYLDMDLVNSMRKLKKFDRNLLFTTAALDVGVTLKDRAITDIVIDMKDPDTIVQAIGRKRAVDDSDYVNVHVKARSNNQIGGTLTWLKNQAAIVEDFLTKGAIAHNAAHNRGNDCFGLIVDVPITIDGKTVFVKEVNKPRYAKVKYDIKVCEEMTQLEHGFMEYISDRLGIYGYSVIKSNKEEQSLIAYLDSLIGKPMLTREDRQPFIKRMNVRRDGKLCKSYHGIAGWIEGSGLPYRLSEYSTSRIIDEQKKNFNQTWEVVKLTGQ